MNLEYHSWCCLSLTSTLVQRKKQESCSSLRTKEICGSVWTFVSRCWAWIYPKSLLKLSKEVSSASKKLISCSFLLLQTDYHGFPSWSIFTILSFWNKLWGLQLAWKSSVFIWKPSFLILAVSFEGGNECIVSKAVFHWLAL